jgi:15-cis-phytoene synthase
VAATTTRAQSRRQTASRSIAGALAISRQFALIGSSATSSLIDDAFAPATASEELMSRHARTFRFASRLLPREFRAPTIRLYEFFRTLDDFVDESSLVDVRTGVVRVEIDAWRDWFRGGMNAEAPRKPLGESVSEVVSSRAIPVDVFLSFLDGLQADIDHKSPLNRDEVERYSYQVASTVGISMAHVFGATRPEALVAAERLGIAMQITNILRDIGGDLARDRLYLPTDLLEANRITKEEIRLLWTNGEGPDERLVAAMREMVGWADEHYRSGLDGVRYLPDDVRMPILVAGRLYQRILRELEAINYDALRSRASTGSLQKLAETTRCLFDPRAYAPSVQHSRNSRILVDDGAASGSVRQ